MKNYRIKIENEFDFNFIRKYLIDNNIGGEYVCVGTFLPYGENFKSLKYDKKFKEINLETYTKEMVDNYLSDGDISPLLWNNVHELVSINTSHELEEGDVNKDIKPINVSEFLLIENK